MSNSKKGIIYEIFEEMNKSSIPYVHFKSNLNIGKSFKGEEDFDILVHKDYYVLFQRLLLKFGAKLRYGTFNTVYCGMEHYLLYDEDYEQLHHFHVHYELIFGLNDEKNYYLPDFGSVFLESEMHSEYPICIVNKRFELFLLIMRILLKFKFSLLYFKKRLVYTLPSSMKDELDDLLNRIHYKDFENWVKEAYPEQAKAVLDFINLYTDSKNIRVTDIIRLSGSMRNALSRFMRTDVKTAKRLSKLRKLSKENKVKWLPGGGKIISLIGVDGAGKSSLAKDTKKWLNSNLSSRNIYLGQLKKSKKLSGINFLAALLKRMGFRKMFGIIRDYRTILYAEERLRKWREARYSSQNGWFVITDRYPLREFWDMPFPMDGPRLPESSYLYKAERKIYNKIEAYPDLMIILDIDYETSAERTDDLSNQQKIQRRHDKIFAVKALAKKCRKKLFVIDATQPYTVVLKTIKQIIWKNI